MSCNKCKKQQCCCQQNQGILRYTGPDIEELGISTGDLIEVVIQNITEYIIEDNSISTLTNNGDGTYTHNSGDGSGTNVTFIVGKHTTGASPHADPNYGDTWYDTSTTQLKWFTNNGSIDVWYLLPTTVSPSFKSATIHHNSASALALIPATHSKKEIHFESTGNITLNGNDHLVSDDYTYLLVNTTAASRTITFTNVAAAWLRDGGPITDLVGTGFTVPPNTSMLLTVTQAGGIVYVNGHFYALEITGDPTNLFSDTVSLVALTPLVVNVPTMVNMESILVLDSTGLVITNAISISVSGDDITLESNVALANIEVRVIYST